MLDIVHLLCKQHSWFLKMFRMINHRLALLEQNLALNGLCGRSINHIYPGLFSACMQGWETMLVKCQWLALRNTWSWLPASEDGFQVSRTSGFLLKCRQFNSRPLFGVTQCLFDSCS